MVLVADLPGQLPAATRNRSLLAQANAALTCDTGIVGTPCLHLPPLGPAEVADQPGVLA